MMNGFNGHGWGMGLGMGWWWIIGIAVVAAIVWLILRNANQNGPVNNPGRKSALEILKERYASGEIGKEEYEQKKKEILS